MRPTHLRVYDLHRDATDVDALIEAGVGGRRNRFENSETEWVRGRVRAGRVRCMETVARAPSPKATTIATATAGLT